MSPSEVPRPDSESAASRASAFVYGNILVLAALIALHPDDLSTLKGVLYVGGTALSTFVAHLLGESVGDRVRRNRPITWPEFRHEGRNSLPIASAAGMPTLLLFAAWFGWLAPLVALLVAELITIGRIAFLGSVVERLTGEKDSGETGSGRTIAVGIVLAVICTAAAGLKLWLTH